ncbi:aspartate kinase [Streptomyces antimycoticus]|uniref:aspartate kinase n=1 Tax=Streptomyces antimycoticus TaxID=68175 RepID=UPI0013749EA7|nr:aspartate kinase [Streptomyces antimycoticus]
MVRITVQKYGGSSLCDATSVCRAADEAVSAHRAGRRVVVVVSAMGQTTDRLLSLARLAGPDPDAQELDVLLGTGERASAALMALAIRARGVPARSFSGPTAGVVTSGSHGRARIVDVDTQPIRADLSAGQLVVVAGFQGADQATGCVTTIGRGGSDATATALAAALQAHVCEIRTDVDGVHTADPQHVPQSGRLARLSYDEVYELARAGARILMPQCVRYAQIAGIPLHVRTATGASQGTWVDGDIHRHSEAGERRPQVIGLAHLNDQAQYVITGLPDQPEARAALLTALEEATVSPAMISWNSATRAGRVNLSFVAAQEDRPATAAVLEALGPAGEHDDIQYTAPLGRLTAVGTSLRSCPSLLPGLMKKLYEHGIEARRWEVRDNRVTVLCPPGRTVDALIVAHDALMTDHGAMALGLPDRSSEDAEADVPAVGWRDAG